MIRCRTIKCIEYCPLYPNLDYPENLLGVKATSRYGINISPITADVDFLTWILTWFDENVEQYTRLYTGSQDAAHFYVFKVCIPLASDIEKYS